MAVSVVRRGRVTGRVCGRLLVSLGAETIVRGRCRGSLLLLAEGF